ncbi:MAG: hypothetical protein ACRDNE_04690, partial [Gaiellaceae bacterium]
MLEQEGGGDAAEDEGRPPLERGQVALRPERPGTEGAVDDREREQPGPLEAEGAPASLRELEDSGDGEADTDDVGGGRRLEAGPAAEALVLVAGDQGSAADEQERERPALVCEDVDVGERLQDGDAQPDEPADLEPERALPHAGLHQGERERGPEPVDRHVPDFPGSRGVLGTESEREIQQTERGRVGERETRQPGVRRRHGAHEIHEVLEESADPPQGLRALQGLRGEPGERGGSGGEGEDAEGATGRMRVLLEEMGEGRSDGERVSDREGEVRDCGELEAPLASGPSEPRQDRRLARPRDRERRARE